MFMIPMRGKAPNMYAGAYNDFPREMRRSSTTSSDESDKTPPPATEESQRRSSVPTATVNATPSPVRTRSVGGFLNAGIVYERDSEAPPSDDDIIIVTVRISKRVRRDSFDEPLPDRPPPRGFIRRMSTRMVAQPDKDKYKAVKMPRGEYLRHFKHDAQGQYAGTEPEREWAEAEINAKYGQYQDMPLRQVLGKPQPVASSIPLCGW